MVYCAFDNSFNIDRLIFTCLWKICSYTARPSLKINSRFWFKRLIAFDVQLIYRSFSVNQVSVNIMMSGLLVIVSRSKAKSGWWNLKDWMFRPKMVDLFGASSWEEKADISEFLFQESQSLLPLDSLLRSSSFAAFFDGGDCFSTSNVKSFSVRLNNLSSLSLWSGCFSFEGELNATCRFRLAGVFF